MIDRSALPFPEGPRRVGFTGTQVGCADVQVAALARTLDALGCKVLHHGDCIGADAIALRVVELLRAPACDRCGRPLPE